LPLHRRAALFDKAYHGVRRDAEFAEALREGGVDAVQRVRIAALFRLALFLLVLIGEAQNQLFGVREVALFAREPELPEEHGVGPDVAGVAREVCKVVVDHAEGPLRILSVAAGRFGRVAPGVQGIDVHAHDGTGAADFGGRFDDVGKEAGDGLSAGKGEEEPHHFAA
jgi:hypothetical protein